MGAMKKMIGKTPQAKGFQVPRPMPMPSFNPPTQEQPDMITPIEDVEKEPKGSATSTPQDWLKPKIFRGGGGLV